MTLDLEARSEQATLAALTRWSVNRPHAEAAARQIRLRIRSKRYRRAATDARRAVHEFQRSARNLLRVAADLDRIAAEAESEASATLPAELNSDQAEGQE
jgi:hypothetical protein